MTHEDERATGYGQPPKSGRFKAGESGNPSGRKSGTKNFRSDIEEELATEVHINVDGTSLDYSCLFLK
ncbi:hypothetical protein V1281_000487 [Nitrobacteraceae bacterium AZCC 2161]